MKNILVICQYYYPENFQITPICEALVKDGYSVTVLTGLPNYPTGIIPDDYKNGRRDEIINGVRVLRVNEIGRKKGAFFLALNYLSFLIAATLKVRTLKEKFDLVFVYQLSPVLMAIPGKIYAKKYNLPLFLYCCDLWPESLKMYVHNESNIIFRMIKKISKSIYQSCDVIATQSESFIPYLVSTHDLQRDKLLYLPAFADENYLSIPKKIKQTPLEFIFLGNLGIAQNLLGVLEAIKIIRNEPNFLVHFVGDGSCLDEMKEYVKKEDLIDKVIFHGRRPVEEMEKFYNMADACLVSLRSDNITGYTLPSKIQGYMAAGKPIFGLIEGATMEVIREAGCGICVKPDDVEGFSNVLKDFIRNPQKYYDCGIKGREYFSRNFKKIIFMDRLENIIENLD